MNPTLAPAKLAPGQFVRPHSPRPRRGRAHPAATRSDRHAPGVDRLLAHLAHYRGKRLRPALLLLTARACGKVTPAHHSWPPSSR